MNDNQLKSIRDRYWHAQDIDKTPITGWLYLTRSGLIRFYEHPNIVRVSHDLRKLYMAKI